MNKKNLRFYEAPMAEVVELKVVAPLLAGSGEGDGLPGGGSNLGDDDYDDNNG